MKEKFYFPLTAAYQNDPYDDDEAPCSYDDEPDDIDDDFGFDPYEGCFTYDC